jgi:hypothetical protein
MKTTLLIATSKCPNARTWPEFDQALREGAQQSGLTPHRIGITDGPGCANLSIEVEGTEEHIDAFANGITMALMPARWTTTTSTPIEGYQIEAI